LSERRSSAIAIVWLKSLLDYDLRAARLPKKSLKSRLKIAPTPFVAFGLVQVLAKQFVDKLAAKQLLMPEMVAELREQIASKQTRLTPELIVRILVERGHLTKFQATKLIAEIRESAPVPVPNATEVASDPDLELIQDVVDIKPIPARFVLEDEATIQEVVEVVESEVVDVVEATDEAEARIARMRTKLEKSSTARTESVATSNPWESFRILGIGGAIVVLTVVLMWLGWQLLRGTPAGIIAKADESYKAQDYLRAATYYQDFTRKFVSDPNFSYANVRYALSTVRQAVEKGSGAQVGLESVVELLPTIAGEAALVNEQSDLAGVLLFLANKFISEADQTPAVESRKKMMSEMERLLSIINDSQYVGGTLRVQLAGNLREIEEGRQRILRTIHSDEELAKTLQDIETKLIAKDLSSAYASQLGLIRRYPHLESDERVRAKAIETSKLQATLVTPGTLEIQLQKEPSPTLLKRSIALVQTTKGPGVAGARQIAVKVKGSLYGMDGQNGNVRWRSFIGQENSKDPVRASETEASDYFVSTATDQGGALLQRLGSNNGMAMWSAQFGSQKQLAKLNASLLEAENLFVSTVDGTVASLAAASGHTNWMVKLPQSTYCQPGSSLGKPNLYIVADHSNLYVLSKSDGTCKEVAYLGHQSGAISVPPAQLLGQLFVFENAGEQSLVRIFSTSNEGLDLQESQTAFTLQGNIVTSGQLEGRRMMVATDRGEVAMFDVDTTAERDKVSQMALIPAFLDTPKVHYLLARKNSIWLVGDGISRWDWVPARKKFEPVWTIGEGSTIVSTPQWMGDSIVVGQSILNSAGTRVMAISADKGEVQWSTEVAAPVVFVDGTDNKMVAMNTAGAIFGLEENKSIATALGPPIADSRNRLFQSAVSVGNIQVSFNEIDSSQMISCSVAGKLQPSAFQLNLRDARLGCASIAVGDKLLISTDYGQVQLLDPAKGTPFGAPFQVPMVPGAKVAWVEPAFFKDSKSVVTANDTKKLYRLGIGDGIRKLSEAELQSPLIGRMAGLGNQAVAIQVGPSSDSIVGFNANSLAKVAEAELGGRSIGELFVVDGVAFAQTHDAVHAFSTDLKRLWSVAIAGSVLVGPPIKHGENWAMLSSNGTVYVVSQDAGKIVGSGTVLEPLRGLTVLADGKLIALGEEGAVIQFELPAH
jgi:outer membrane protein assembly factor BamB